MHKPRTTYDLPDEAATLALGQKLATHLKPADIVAMRGDLGAGKTTLSRGIIVALTGESEVPSPTYTIIQTYEGDDSEIWHCDLYRIENPDDILELGLLDAFEDSICLIEWPDKMGDYLPDNIITISIRFNGTGRTVTIDGLALD